MEPLAHTSRVVTEVAAHHILAGRADHVPLDVVDDPVAEPEGQGARPRAAGEHSHKGVARTNSRRQVVDEGLKEILPGVAREFADQPAADISAAIHERLTRFRGPAKQVDDVTYVVIKLAPATGTGQSNRNERL
jgi:hypothetical protein